MKYIYLNLKRFDIPKELGGVNQVQNPKKWAEYILSNTQDQLKKYEGKADFTMFFPEAHLIPAIETKKAESEIKIGSQGVYREDVAEDGNFGAFTTHRTAKSMTALGTESALIGHLEERNNYREILQKADSLDTKIIDQILNKEIIQAQNAGMEVLYCVGERANEQDNWQEVLRKQLNEGLNGIKPENIAIAYEPVWAIGPGKTPPDKEYIQKIVRYIKEETNNQIPVVYGGGLNTSNAEMLSSIEEVDGGLIALTRFSGEIGFYPEEYLDIIQLYMKNN